MLAQTKKIFFNFLKKFMNRESLGKKPMDGCFLLTYSGKVSKGYTSSYTLLEHKYNLQKRL